VDFDSDAVSHNATQRLLSKVAAAGNSENTISYKYVAETALEACVYYVLCVAPGKDS
jgi:hypothetical protein